MSRRLIFASIIVLVAAFALAFAPTNAQDPDCSLMQQGGFPHLGSIEVSFECSAPQIVHFGVCDSGGVPDDDLFNVTFMGNEVSSNRYVSGREFTSIGSAQASSGTNTSVIRSLVDTPFPPATYSVAVSPDRGAVVDYLSSWCGTDFGGTGLGYCTRMVPVFTTDTAPTDGTLQLNVQYGEMNRSEGWTLQTWNVEAGERINNDYVGVPAPKYVRLWWNPSGSATWYMLPSQYWAGDGTLASEYGVSCDVPGVPSYHTSFGSAIPADQVPAVNALN